MCEEPSDRQVACSGEFLRLLRHNNVCGSCGDEGHADARSSECALFRTRVDKAMADRDLAVSDKDSRRELKVEMTTAALRDRILI